MEQYIKLTTALRLFNEYGIHNVIDMELNSYGNVEFECAFSSHENLFYDVKGVIINNAIIDNHLKHIVILFSFKSCKTKAYSKNKK